MPIANIGAVPDVVTATVIASEWGNAIGSASKGRAVQRFNSIAERDASITAPVAGMLCYVLATDLFYGYRSASGWTVVVGGPRDTMHARVYRAGAFTVSNSATTGVSFDTISRDPMGMWSGSQFGFIAPVAGLYLVVGSVTATPAGSPASGQFLAVNVALNGVSQNSVGVHQSMSFGFGVPVTAALQVAAGGLIQTSCSSAPGALAGQPGPASTYMSIDYLGTG